jgi:microcystin-dependent protein
MSYNSGINQRVISQEFFQNTTAEDQPLTQTNLGLLANLKYVQTYLQSVINTYLPILNPTFQGTMTGPTSIINSLSVNTVTGNPNFTGIPTINNNTISSSRIGQIKMFICVPPNLNNYIICNGQSLKVSNYQALFNVIGYTYGGYGTNFTLPNLQNKFLIGGNNNINGLSVSNYATSNYVNSYNFQNSSSSSNQCLLTQVPPHTHSINDPGHAHLSNVHQEFSTYAIEPPIYALYQNEGEGGVTSTAYTGILETENFGSNITTDPINITPPFVSVNFYICYN